MATRPVDLTGQAAEDGQLAVEGEGARMTLELLFCSI